jgi:ABC-type multidrug transport system fused ATPase/permease subunit
MIFNMRERLRKFIELLGRKNLVLLLLGIVVGMAWFATESGFVYVLQIFLSAIGLVPPSTQLTFFQNLPHGLNFACGLLLLFAFFRFLTTVARASLAVAAQQGFVYHIRSQLLSRSLEGEVSLSAHDVLGLFSEITNNGGLLIYNLVMLVVHSCAVLFFTAVAFWLAPLQTVIGLAIFVLALWPIKYGVRSIGQLGQRVQEEWQEVNYNLSTAIKNKFFLKLYGTVGLEVERGERTLQTYFRHQRKFGLWLGLLNASPVLIGAISIVVVTYVGSKFSPISPMNLLAFLYIFMRMAQLGSETNTVLSSVRFYVPSFQALYDWLFRKQPIMPKDVEGVREISKIESVRFENVEFSFDRRSIFRDMNFEVKMGETLAIIGQSGSGKSTLLSVLLGLLQSSKGKVLINGHVLSNLHPRWREKVAYVGPDPFTIEGTIRENLLYGNRAPKVEDEKIWSAIETVGLKQDILESPEGIEFYLKSATRLSTGQLQRLSIARALLRDFDVLIFDEGTANLDAATSDMILSRVREIVNDKIFVRVTHQRVNEALEKIIELRSDRIRGPELTN